MKFKLLCIVFVLDCAFAKRISELKCEDTESLNHDIISRYPHLFMLHPYPIHVAYFCVCYATLISSDFVLTSANCCIFIVRDLSYIRVFKNKQHDEQYQSDFGYSSVKRVFKRVHELYNKEISSAYSIALVQLQQPIPYHSSPYIRPACLWTDTFPTSNKYQTYGMVPEIGTQDTKFTTIPLTTVSDNECNTAQFENFLENFFKASDYSISFVCFNKSIGSVAITGSPIEVKVNNRNYIYAIVESCYLDCKGVKISNNIDWIESIVWPNQIDSSSNLECGQRKVKHKEFMTYAQSTYHGEFPWHVGIYRNNQKYICGGTIISNRVVLTAAHCVHDARGVLPPNRLSVIAGTHSLIEYPIEAKNYNVESIMVHRYYSRVYLENDIAVLKLIGTIEFSNYIQPICLNNSLDYTNITFGLVAGWGRDENNQQSDVLLQAVLPIRNNFECRASNRDFFSQYLNDHNYCAGYANGTNVCSGDSGGGMIVEHESRWYLRGIVSMGMAVPNSDRCDVTQLVLFTNVPRLYDWIIKNVEDEY